MKDPVNFVSDPVDVVRKKRRRQKHDDKTKTNRPGPGTQNKQKTAHKTTSLPELPPTSKSKIPPEIFTHCDPDADINLVSTETLDRLSHVILGRMTFGLSPAALAQAYADWLQHLAIAPGKQAKLAQKAIHKALRLWRHMAERTINPECEACIGSLPQDRRFRHLDWQRWPFNIVYQSFLLNQQWWHNATTDVPGVSKHHEHAVSFAARQILDIFSPSNFVLSNPEILRQTSQECGMNLNRGFLNFVEDWKRSSAARPLVGSEKYVVGENVAVTPGKVIYRNRLIELIQYLPATEAVQLEPILIVPAWIMKYYILDLSPENSLVRYLVEHGHTVFVLSWLNPGTDDRDLGMDDYLYLGVMAALNKITMILPGTKVHALGYCLGGTLLAIAAAAMARDDDHRLKSVTLLAAQTDFTDAGELMLFIDDSEVTFLEDMMWEQGYLDTKHMAGAFQLLRSNDLIWSKAVREYLLGQRGEMTDLMAWNADATRLPYRMHSEYLRRLFLENDLARSSYQVDGRAVSLMDIRVPIFVVATEWDHVAPWRSVYKIKNLTDTEVTFLLTNGGHNAGIISEPEHEGRHYRVSTKAADAPYMSPDRWMEITPICNGSWWPAWEGWLTEKSSGMGSPPKIGSEYVHDDAPGRYVFMS